MTNGTKVFKHSAERITNEWILANADEVLPSDKIGYQWCRFDVERADDGYLSVFVQTITDERETFTIELETGVAHSEGMSTERLGLGLYSLQDDLKALLEILARGNHF